MPARPSDAVHNIRVAPERLRPFAFGDGADEAVLWYDLRTAPDVNVAARLGAGRAGFHHGAYVKGVGRTPAAANWNDVPDVYHGSGHLSIASLLREWLVSRALVARGLGDAIVPAEGVLVRALAPAERDEIDRAFAPALSGHTPADGALAGLVVREGGWARPSNLVWALDRVDPTDTWVGDTMLALLAALGRPDADGTPEDVGAALRDAGERGLANYARYVRHGVFWLSFHDNTTLDGRFVDLETPVFFGAPTVAAIASDRDGDRRPRWAGFEAFRFAAQWRLFLAWLANRLRFLARHALPGAGTDTRAYLREVAREVDVARGVFPDDETLVARVVGELARVLVLEGPEVAELDALARAEAALRLRGRAARLPDVALVDAPFEPAQSNPTVRLRLRVPRWMAARVRVPDDALAFREAIARLERITDRDALLDALSGAAAP